MRLSVLAIGASLIIWLPAAASAQRPPAADAASDSAAIPDSAFDATVRAELRGIIARARADDLPIAPLANRALQGMARQVRGTDVVTLVRAHADSMRAARYALGAAASPDELDAGGAALSAGAARLTLRRIRLARPDGRGAVALVVLTDLLGRGFSPADAAAALLSVANVASDGALLALQGAVARQGGSPSRGGDASLRAIAARVAHESSLAEGSSAPPGSPRFAIPPRRQPR